MEIRRVKQSFSLTSLKISHSAVVVKEFPLSTEIFCKQSVSFWNIKSHDMSYFLSFWFWVQCGFSQANWMFFWCNSQFIEEGVMIDFPYYRSLCWYLVQLGISKRGYLHPKQFILKLKFCISFTFSSCIFFDFLHKLKGNLILISFLLHFSKKFELNYL